MKEQYSPTKMRPVTDALTAAQHAIEAIVCQNDEENVFDYRESNPELYKLYMSINEAACEAFELFDN